ncbi:MAG: pyrimidine/purine nucleoside phosphorylase [Gammaproteobacteria bacterium]|nr:pyrimidine/purine nucleoside phosphorylase [Gammaproteobacteria bacterium]MCK5092162.1 pyrimidine/purine nucleoside phosphorylase [Gammaproteobacteria bacterium]
MSEFSNVTVIKKVNSYFDGNVTSRTLRFSDGAEKTLGFMLPGEYQFNTGDKESIEVYSGDIEVMFPDTECWEKINVGDSFEVPANATFKVKISSPVDYCCSFIK